VLIAGNWKMYKSPAEVGPFFEALKKQVGDLPIRIAIAPPFPLLTAPAAREPLELFAQNVHWEPEGPYTGEVSPQTLLELRVDGAIVGHSERRQYFGESDEAVARRARAALAAGLSVIACVGETQEQRDSDDTELVLRIQVEGIRAAVGAHERLVLAYEPVWAIGTGNTATPEQVQGAHAFVKGLLDVPVLYGGSVKPENAEELLSQPDVDGALVGGASLDLDSFTAICRTAARIGS
jgi:triosephosphate isomerase (TIM)